MILSRELGKRIWGGSTNMENGGGGVSSDAIAGLLTGYATESWVDEHYISIDFFSRLFQAHGTENGSEIDVIPNDMETTITSVESMFGFWTNLYISALGSNGAAPAGISLGMLTDVVISGTPSAGQVLTFDAVTQKWVNGNAQAGATALANLTDVTLTTLDTNQILVYNATAQKWVNSSVKTINGYSIFGTGDIPASGGGTGNYLPLTGGTLTGALHFAKSNFYKTSSSGYPSISNFTNSIINSIGTANGTDNYGLFFWGTWYDGAFHMQCGYKSGETEALPIILQEFGGNIGIGNQNPQYTLEVNGITSTRYTLFKDSTGTERGFVGYASNSDLIQLTSQTSYVRITGAYLNIVCSSGGILSKVIPFFNASAAGYPTLGNMTSNYVSKIVISDSATGYGLGFWGTRNNGVFHIQNGYINGEAESLPIALQELGGYVGIGTSTPAYELDINGVAKCIYMYFRGDNGTEVGFIGRASSSNNIYINSSNNLFIHANYVGVGTTSPTYKLHVAGTIYATGAITALSDARKKDITGEAGVTVEQIAHAPAVQFLWKDKERRKEGQQVGTLAQYWRTVLPEVVSDKGGELSMQYGVAALVSAIITARKVVDHERRIHELEKENERLKEEISQLRLN